MNVSLTVAEGTTLENLLAHAREGKVKIHTVRSNGTLRRVQYLAAGTSDRELAEYVLALREGTEDAGPRTMRSIASELHVSIPTVRRLINAYLITVEIEEEPEEFMALATVDPEPEPTTPLS